MASFSISLGGGSRARKPSPTRPQNGVKRTYAALDDADSDDEDVNLGKRQSVTHFDVTAGGAVDVSKPKVVKEALVIKPQANRDWKQASLRNKRQKYGLPSEEQEKAKLKFVVPVPSTSYGLNVHKPEAKDAAAADVEGSEVNTHSAPSAEVSKNLRSDDERAIAALMGIKEESTLTIPAITEHEALERDVQEAPDAPTLEEYAAVPVEDFGAAMLRGMGWKEGQGIGNQRGQKTTKSKIPERRPALLGIGAKPDAAVAAELGAWGAGARGRKRVEIVYNPLVLKNSRTGEQLTEEELKAKLREQKEQEENNKYVRNSDQEHRREDRSSRRHHRDTSPGDREDGREKERRRGTDHDEGRRRRRRDRSASVDKHRSRRDRSASYDKPREQRRDRDYARDDRKDQDRRRRRHDDDYDHRERKRDHGRYDDDRNRRHRH